jgi:hypothetical protein
MREQLGNHQVDWKSGLFSGSLVDRMLDDDLVTVSRDVERASFEPSHALEMCSVNSTTVCTSTTWCFTTTNCPSTTNCQSVQTCRNAMESWPYNHFD